MRTYADLPGGAGWRQGQLGSAQTTHLIRVMSLAAARSIIGTGRTHVSASRRRFRLEVVVWPTRGDAMADRHERRDPP
jgi:hypothetical protein